MCVDHGAGQGATTRNGHSIPRRSNAAMRREERAIRFVATHTLGERDYIAKFISDHFLAYSTERSTAVSRIICFALAALCANLAGSANLRLFLRRNTCNEYHQL